MVIISLPSNRMSGTWPVRAPLARSLTHPPIPMMNFILKPSQMRVNVGKDVNNGSMTLRMNAWKEKVKGNVNYSTPPWRWMKAGRWRFFAIFLQRETRALAAAETLPVTARWLDIYTQRANANRAQPIRAQGPQKLRPSVGKSMVFLCCVINVALQFKDGIFIYILQN